MRMLGASLLALSVTASANASDTDWKAYAFVERADGDLVCFYDARSLSSFGMRTRVFVKCVLQRELQDFTEIHRTEIRGIASRKMSEGYVPPFVAALGVNRRRVMAITAAEQVANMGETLRIRGSFVYELDCADWTERRLSAYGLVDEKEVQDNAPGEWTSLPPESNGAMLARILCPIR